MNQKIILRISSRNFNQSIEKLSKLIYDSLQYPFYSCSMRNYTIMHHELINEESFVNVMIHNLILESCKPKVFKLWIANFLLVCWSGIYIFLYTIHHCFERTEIFWIYSQFFIKIAIKVHCFSSWPLNWSHKKMCSCRWLQKSLEEGWILSLCKVFHFLLSY